MKETIITMDCITRAMARVDFWACDNLIDSLNHAKIGADKEEKILFDAWIAYVICRTEE